MLPDFPGSLWVEIAEKCLLVKRDVICLASTNREMRQLLLPLLFQSVEFRGFPSSETSLDDSDETQELHLKSLAPFYIRIHKRVGWLERRPNLLPYVKTFRLCGWSQLSALLEDDPDMWYTPVYGAALDCWMAAYEALVGLMSILPSLKVLAVLGSPITPALQNIFYLSPQLESLMLSGCEIEVGRSNIPRRQVVSHLKDLAYQPSSSNAEYLDTCFKQLLRRCLPSLVSLKVPMYCVESVASIVSVQCHTLQHLVISESPFGPIGMEKASAVYDLLKSCIALKTLKILGWVDRDLPDLGEHAPPNLDYISGTSTVFQALVPGRPIHSIHLQYCPLDPFTASSFNLSRPSTVSVHRVYFDCGTNLPSEVITALGSAFRQLTHLTIRFLRGYTSSRLAAVGVRCPSVFAFNKNNKNNN